MPDRATFSWTFTFYKCRWDNQVYGSRYQWTWTQNKPPAEFNPECTEYRVGYLTVPLDYDDSREESKISLELRVSAKLACSTDDSKESCPILFYHSGGPGSNDATISFNDYGGRYDTIGIAQRGVGEDEHWLKEKIYAGSFNADGSLTDPYSVWNDPYKSFPVDKSVNNKNLADSSSWPQHTRNACGGYNLWKQGIHPPRN